ncbi:MAG TPA: ABC transporter ATP-binding protein [Candidatus Eisenbacteria bacterium]|jgi:putative ABC transport system ATP-binding protein|nr:ABC transporter ATP-binding protein [Candidatus Eisenbacteria bacterium]
MESTQATMERATSETRGGILVRLRGVHKKYSRERNVIHVLAGIDLEVKEGEFLALMGPSGSGKSTLLNLIGGIDKPSEGDVWVAGQSLASLSSNALAAWRARHVGFIFQLYNLIPVLTAQQNVELPLLLTRLSGKERKERVALALRLVGLEGRAHHFPRQLSGGEEQRVAIARAFVADPTLLVADEPTGDLDAKNADEILTLLQRLNQEMKKTILMVTHDPNAATRAHTTLHLDKGVLRP